MSPTVLDIALGYGTALYLAVVVLLLMLHGFRTDRRLKRAETLCAQREDEADSVGLERDEAKASAEHHRAAFTNERTLRKKAEDATEELRKSLMRGSAVGRWHRIHAEPSADEWYHHVVTAEGPLLLTDEQWQVARARASKLLTK